MGIRLIRIWEAVNADSNISETGQLTAENFTIYLNRLQINLLRFLTGDLVDVKDFPEPFKKQKNKDYLKNFITKKLFNNNLVFPSDYYHWDNLYKLGRVVNINDCDLNSLKKENCDIEVPILDGQKFKKRCISYIKSLRPSNGKPIAKVVDNEIVTEPKDAGSMCLEYIRYPKEVKLVTIIDQATNDEIVDDNASGELEWDMWALEYFVNGIVNLYSKRNRDLPLKQLNDTDKARG